MRTLYHFAIFSLVISFCQCGLLDSSSTNTDNPSPKTTTNPNISKPNPKSKEADFSEKDLEYKGKEVVLTKHARCRMDCRFIDPFEIQEVINKNQINNKKTNKDATPCPTIAYEGLTRDKQQVRIIVGDCNPAKIITVIDLDNEFECACK